METSSDSAKIVTAALRLAQDRKWTDIKLSEIAAEAGVGLAALQAAVGSRMGILKLFMRDIDQRMLASLEQNPVTGDAHDRLFEVLMRRLEVMAPYRRAIANMISDPGALFDSPPELAASLSKSLGWVLAAAGVDERGGRELVRRIGLAGIYRRVLAVWVEDDDPGLARTMAALDRSLRDGEAWLKRVEPGLSLISTIGTVAGRLFRGRRGAQT